MRRLAAKPALYKEKRYADNDRKQNGIVPACVHTGAAVGAQPNIYPV
jgi:hypothetical protein